MSDEDKQPRKFEKMVKPRRAREPLMEAKIMQAREPQVELRPTKKKDENR